MTPVAPTRLAAALVPYVAVAAGLRLAHSAWLALLLYYAGIAMVLTIGRAWPLARLLVRGFRPLGAAGAILFGVAGWALVATLGPQVEAGALAPAIVRVGLSGLSWWLFIVTHTLLHPWMEELYWRGFLGSDRHAPSAGDLLFAGYHLLVLEMFVGPPWLAVSFAVLAGAAWLWRTLARWSGGLLLPALSHLAANAGILVVAERVMR